MAEHELTGEAAGYGTYVFIWLCLLALTGTTVAVSRMGLASYAALAAIAIATAKAGLVVTYFMHLKQEPWILRIMLVVVLIALSLIILLTFSDVSFRHG